MKRKQRSLASGATARYLERLISDALPFGRLWYGEPKRSQRRS
jgi:hypothetical protein